MSWDTCKTITRYFTDRLRLLAKCKVLKSKAVFLCKNSIVLMHNSGHDGIGVSKLLTTQLTISNLNSIKTNTLEASNAVAESEADEC